MAAGNSFHYMKVKLRVTVDLHQAQLSAHTYTDTHTHTHLPHTHLPPTLICTQGKSRSSVAVIAYIMATDEGTSRNFEESLKFVRERRRMADPNPSFIEQLQDFASSEALKQLIKELKPWPFKLPSLYMYNAVVLKRNIFLGRPANCQISSYTVIN